MRAFIAGFAAQSPKRWFAARLLNETRSGEQTEAFIATVAEDCGCSEAEREEVIGAALDAGLIRATVSAAQQGYAHQATLVAC